jgi:predicted dehydrogenase
MTDKIRWGILSTANIGRRAVTPAIRASENGVLMAVASRDANKATEYAGQFGIPRSYASYGELLADPEVDAIYNPLPNSLHREWTIRALEAGKHVLCEKPLSLDAAECVEMFEAAKQNDRILMEAFMYRFHPRMHRMLELLASRPLGDVKLIRSAFTFPVLDPSNIRLQPELGGGALMDVGCYCVNVSRTLLGREPVEAQAFEVQGGAGVDVELIGVLRFEGDVFAQFHCAMNTFRQEFVEVVGSEGRLRLDSAFLPGTADAVIQLDRQGEGKTEVVVPGAEQYRLMVEHFAECALKGTEPRYGLDDAAANMAAITALYESARDGGRPKRVAAVT